MLRFPGEGVLDASVRNHGATAGDEEVVQRPAIRFQILVALPGHRRDDTRDELLLILTSLRVGFVEVACPDEILLLAATCTDVPDPALRANWMFVCGAPPRAQS